MNSQVALSNQMLENKLRNKKDLYEYMSSHCKWYFIISMDSNTIFIQWTYGCQNLNIADYLSCKPSFKTKRNIWKPVKSGCRTSRKDGMSSPSRIFGSLLRTIRCFMSTYRGRRWRKADFQISNLFGESHSHWNNSGLSISTRCAWRKGTRFNKIQYKRRLS